MPYRVVVRIGGQVKRSQAIDLEHALDLLEMEGKAAQKAADVRGIDMGTRQFEPVQQVYARLELRGASGDGLIGRMRRGRAIGGVDVRGDGSAEAYLGQLSRELVDQHAHEEPYDAFRRAVVEASA